LATFARAEQRAKAVEAEAAGARKRRDETEVECGRKVLGVFSTSGFL
jgi:hypothetical protein